MGVQGLFDLRDEFVHRADEISDFAGLLCARDPPREVRRRLDLGGRSSSLPDRPQRQRRDGIRQRGAASDQCRQTRT